MVATVSPNAGLPAMPAMLVNVPRLVTDYFTEVPDAAEASQRIAFGTSGHRGSAFTVSFNEAHIVAMSQAVCDHRRAAGIDGPLFLGIDTHALSEPAFASALEVLAANGVVTMIDGHRGYTPTPVVSHAILAYNRGRNTGSADGIVITPQPRSLDLIDNDRLPARLGIAGIESPAPDDRYGQRLEKSRRDKMLRDTDRFVWR